MDYTTKSKMNYKTRIQYTIDELETCVDAKTELEVRRLLLMMKEVYTKIIDHHKKMIALGVKKNAPTSAMADWPAEHLLMVIKRERLIKRIRAIRNKISQCLGGHDYYIASLHLFGDCRDYSTIK